MKRDILRHVRLIFLFILSALLVGCMATEKYDIDITCDNRAGNAVERGTLYDDDDTQTWSCYSVVPVIHIQCKKNTVQILGDAVLCSTHDGKSVRFRDISH